MKKITPKSDNMAHSYTAEEEVNLIESFFKKLAATKKMFIIQNRNHTGQHSGNEVDHPLPVHEPEKIYANGAWVGFKFGEIFYRTDLIEHKKAFIAWIKEKLDATRDFFWKLSEPFICPPHIHFYSSVAA